jgi:mannosylglycerate hydrolase
MMQKVHVIAHTHWDFEWYFTRQHARVQFAYHMKEVFHALASNRLDYYLLDGQMSIVDDYLQAQPDMRGEFEKYVKAGRLFVGPWYTQIDEMTTSGEAIVRNLQLGHQLGNRLGGVLKVGYLPDSFGQGQDMPKIYNGFDITATVFWRGMPADKTARYFYWRSDDDSTVLAANIKNGYYAGVELMDSDDFSGLFDKIGSDTHAHDLVLPVGGDQRPVDNHLKQRIQAANAAQSDYQVVESTYPAYFKALAETKDLPIYAGEFADATASKIHRGIYSSRADLKQLYDRLERMMIDVVEPLMVVGKAHGLDPQPGLVDQIWKAIVRGQAHDSAGGCNSDETNRDIHQRGEVAWQMAEALKDYLLRKLSTAYVGKLDLFFWNPTPRVLKRVMTTTVATRQAAFSLSDSAGATVAFEVLDQKPIDAAITRRDITQMVPDVYYQTTIAIPLTIQPLDWTGLTITETTTAMAVRETSDAIDNGRYRLSVVDGKLNLLDHATEVLHPNWLTFEDGGDEGDTYDFSPAFNDWVLKLDFAKSAVTAVQGKLVSYLKLSGQWALPLDLKARGEHVANGEVTYQLTLTLTKGSDVIGYQFELTNTVLDHRLRVVLHTPIQATSSYTDSPFGTAERPVVDPHLANWQAQGYHEEPTALRPFLHFVNTHNETASWTFLGLGEKDCQLIGEHFEDVAITMLRGVGFLGRPDTLRRPGDASGLQTKYVPTPDSQLQGQHCFKGGIVLSNTYDPAALQRAHQDLSVGTLAYQNQTLDRFTSPIQYFMIDKLETPLTHVAMFDVDASQLVISSVVGLPDDSGVAVRVYNPTKQVVANGGQLNLATLASISQLNLNHEVKATLASDVKHLDLGEFKPGEIKTFGIHPKA